MVCGGRGLFEPLEEGAVGEGGTPHAHGSVGRQVVDDQDNVWRGGAMGPHTHGNRRGGMSHGGQEFHWTVRLLVLWGHLRSSDVLHHGHSLDLPPSVFLAKGDSVYGRGIWSIRSDHCVPRCCYDTDWLAGPARPRPRWSRTAMAHWHTVCPRVLSAPEPLQGPQARALLEGEGGHRGSPKAVAERSQAVLGRLSQNRQTVTET